MERHAPILGYRVYVRPTLNKEPDDIKVSALGAKIKRRISNLIFFVNVRALSQKFLYLPKIALLGGFMQFLHNSLPPFRRRHRFLYLLA